MNRVENTVNYLIIQFKLLLKCDILLEKFDTNHINRIDEKRLQREHRYR